MTERQVFDLERFIGDCRTAVAEDPSHRLVREAVARAVASSRQRWPELTTVGEP